MELAINEEGLICAVFLALAIPLSSQSSPLLFSLSFLFGGIGIIGLVDDIFFKSQLLIRLLGAQDPEQNPKGVEDR